MPKIIHKTLFQRLERSSTWRDLQEDFRLLSSGHLVLLPPSRSLIPEHCSCCRNSLCEKIRVHPMGKQHCLKVEDSVCSNSGEGISELVCDAGLIEMGMPLRVGGAVVAYLIAGGYRVGSFQDIESRNRFRHLTQRLGIEWSPGKLDSLQREVKVCESRAHQALQRWLKFAVAELLHTLAVNPDHAGRPLPAPILKVCAWVQRHYDQPLPQNEAAALAEMSPSYFCRLFHESTGLRYVEYVNQTRIQVACNRLVKQKQTIAEIAFACGFQSLSQFNRTFQKIHDCSPREWLKRNSTV